MGQKDSISSVPWWTSLIPEISEMSKIEHSGKMVLLMKILRHCELVGDKLLVFSQSLTTLDLIEEFLVMEGFENQSRNSINSNEVDDGCFLTFFSVFNISFHFRSSTARGVSTKTTFDWTVLLLPKCA